MLLIVFTVADFHNIGGDNVSGYGVDFLHYKTCFVLCLNTLVEGTQLETD